MSYREVLSDREASVVALLGHGQSVSEIALLLGLSVKTVSTYRARALDKLFEKGLIERATTAAAMRLVILEETALAVS